MERLTFEGNFCDIAMCSETPGGSFCEDGSCSQRKVWERLKAYEDAGAVPVVRCRECKHSAAPSKLTKIYGQKGALTCHYGPCNRRNINEADFCSYGERRDDNG